jgi:hypothetical protein
VGWWWLVVVGGDGGCRDYDRDRDRARWSAGTSPHEQELDTNTVQYITLTYCTWHYF